MSGLWGAAVRKLAERRATLHRSIIKRTQIAPLLATVPRDAVILEIGGGYNPRYLKSEHPNVHHLDHCTTAELRAKYAADPTVAHQVGRIQDIDFVCVGQPVDAVVPAGLRFDLIYGSHVLEHQVDLIGHLQSLRRLLAPGGRIIQMIPDLRTCFDALRYPTVTADALAVHRAAPPIHRGRQLFDALSREIDRNPGHPVTEADLDIAVSRRPLREAYDALRAADADGAPYLDVHAWVFTPDSFRLLMIELRLLGLVALAPTFLSTTYGNQFCAVLEPVDDAPGGPDGATRERLEAERLAVARRLRV